MNKYYKVAFLLFFLTTAKSLVAQTSIDDYNYASKGLKIQLESGLDMKAGYSLSKIDSLFLPYETYTNQFSETYGSAYFYYAMKRLINSKLTTVAYVVSHDNYEIVFDEKGNTKFKIIKRYDFSCIPLKKSDEEVYSKFYDSLKDSKEQRFMTVLLHFLLNNQAE